MSTSIFSPLRPRLLTHHLVRVLVRVVAPLASLLGRRSDQPSGNRGSRQVARSLLAAISVAIAAISVIASGSGVTAAARTWHVEVAGNDAASGASDAPLATIAQAVRKAQSGDTIRIGPGTFHESVQVYSKALTITGAGMGSTILDGTRVVSGFTSIGGGRFSATWSSWFDREGLPFTSADRPEGGWPEQFFLDGVQLVEVGDWASIGPGTFYYDRSADYVVLGDDPTGRLVEGSDLNWGVYLNHADGSSLSGVTVQRYATQASNMAAIRAYADDLTITDVEVRDNARIGLSLIGDRIRVNRVTSTDNGHLGIHGHRSQDLSILNSTVHRNNREFFDPWHSAGGIKVTEVHGYEVRGNDIRSNGGPGIWTDLDVRNAVIADNYITDSLRSGIEVELSSSVIVVDNVVSRSGEQGVYVLESSNVDVWHNHLSSSERAIRVLDGPRTDLVGVRVGNNVLAGPSAVGILAAVDDWTRGRTAIDMQVWFDGNRYWSNTGDRVLRLANWPNSLIYADDLDEVHAVSSHEQYGEVSTAAQLPYESADLALVPVPGHVAQVRSSQTGSSTTTSSTTTTSPTTTPVTTIPNRTTTSTTTSSTAPGASGSGGAETVSVGWPSAVVRDPDRATATRGSRGASAVLPSQPRSLVEQTSGTGTQLQQAQAAASGDVGWDAFAAALGAVLVSAQ